MKPPKHGTQTDDVFGAKHHYADTPQDDDYRGLMETLYFLSNPEMKAKLIDGKETPLSDCIPEELL